MLHDNPPNFTTFTDPHTHTPCRLHIAYTNELIRAVLACSHYKGAFGNYESKQRLDALYAECAYIYDSSSGPIYYRYFLRFSQVVNDFVFCYYAHSPAKYLNRNFYGRINLSDILRAYDEEQDEFYFQRFKDIQATKSNSKIPSNHDEGFHGYLMKFIAREIYAQMRAHSAASIANNAAMLFAVPVQVANEEIVCETQHLARNQ